MSVWPCGPLVQAVRWLLAAAHGVCVWFGQAFHSPAEILFGNDEIVALFEGERGLIMAMHDICRQPPDGNDDRRFISRVNRDLKSNAALGPVAQAGSHGQQFSIRHYRGPTLVYTGAFIDLNKSLLPKEVHGVLQKSGSKLVRDIVSTATGVMPTAGGSRKLGGVVGQRGSAPGQGAKELVATTFQESLQGLIRRWDQRDALHFVRCIASNRQSSHRYDSGAVLEQLRQANIPEYILARRASHVAHYAFRSFLSRWGTLLPLDRMCDLEEKEPERERLACEEVMSLVDWKPNVSWEVGKTRLFLSTQAVLILDGECRIH